MVSYDVYKDENKLVFKFTGRLDTEICMKIDHAISEKVMEVKSIVSKTGPGLEILFDLKEVSYISSSFMRICLRTAKNKEEGRFSVINADPFIKKTFKVCGLDEILQVV
jgi:anti-anti-sigma factor